MPLKTVLILALLVVSTTVGDVLLSVGMKQVGEITSATAGELLRVGLRAARNPFVLGGVLALIVAFISFSIALSWEDVSLVVPISAVSFLLTALVAQRTLGEHVSPQRWLGTVLIVLGVILVARSSSGATNDERRTTNDERAAVQQPR